MPETPLERLRSDVQVAVFLVERLVAALLTDAEVLDAVERLAPRVLGELAAWAVDVPQRFNEGPRLEPLLSMESKRPRP